MIQFTPLSGREIKAHFPAFFHQNASFFIFQKENQDYGLYGLKPLNRTTCEISLHIFRSSRKKIRTKGDFFDLLNFPFTLNFTKVLIATSLHKLQCLLKRLNDTTHLFTLHSKAWFIRTKS